MITFLFKKSSFMAAFLAFVGIAMMATNVEPQSTDNDVGREEHAYLALRSKSIDGAMSEGAVVAFSANNRAIIKLLTDADSVISATVKLKPAQYSSRTGTEAGLFGFSLMVPPYASANLRSSQ